jgi:tetratricopeptide (TPR) repeat protein
MNRHCLAWFSSVAVLAMPCAAADLRPAQDFLRENQPGKAAEAINDLLAAHPDDPWLVYNTGVTAYAAKDFTKADEIWESLAGKQLPPALNEHVWTQIGNVSYRLVQNTIAKEPDLAVTGLEQSREAYKVALSHNKHNKLAADNLLVVEKELEKLYALLAQRLVAESKKESQLEKQIEKLQAALDYQQNANALAPKDAAHEQAEKDIEKMLSEKFTTKAEKGEKQADQNNSDSAWANQRAREQLETALADYRQAETFDAQNQPAKEGEQRVQEKLANLLAKEGRREQREAENQGTPERALDHFDAALQNFEQALELKPEHQDAHNGEKEKIHLDEGDRDERTAEEQAKHSPDRAGEKMLGALEHFEQARDLDPGNKEIQDRIDRVEKELPDMLMAMSKREMHEAAQAEPKSPGNAVAHLERAETALDKTEQIQPDNQEAKDMQAQVQNDLARLRAQLAQEAEQQEQQGQHPGKQQQGEEDLAKMVSQAKALKDQKEVYMRHSPPHEYDPNYTPNLRNW